MESNTEWTKEVIEKDYIEKMTAITISTDISIDGKQRILNLDEVKQLLLNANRIAQSECGCRRKIGKCDKGLDGCIGLDEEADRSINEEGRELTVDEALKILEESYNRGLVHMAYVYKEDENPRHICSCCSCCCHSLGAALRMGYSDHVLDSKMIAVQDTELCTDCGECVDRCHFNARELVDEKLNFESAKCAGCGLCLKTCPNEAIILIRRNV